MTDEEELEELKTLEEVELDAEEIQELPDREVLSLVDPIGDTPGAPPLAE